MSFLYCYEKKSALLMEGALGERLKREYGFSVDSAVALAEILYEPGGKEALCALWGQYIDIAKKYQLPFIATTPTRRANKERVFKAGYDEAIIFDNVSCLRQLRNQAGIEMYIGGLMGCKGDAYQATEILTEKDAEGFHSWQAELFMQAGVDFLYAGIMPAVSEAIGMARAMENTSLPYIVSFMVRKNGKLPDGTSIHDAILQIDGSVQIPPVCYMANCIHPTVLLEALSQDFNQTPLVRQRFHGIQANTSPLSPEELDDSADLKSCDCIELAQSIQLLKEVVSLKIVGGCCGTDHTHIDQIAQIFSK